MRAAWAMALVVASAALAGCTDGGFSGSGTGGGAAVSNEPGAFSYSAGGVQSGSHTYTWQNPSARAHVSYSAGGTGSVSVTLHDAAGTQVFQRSFSGSGGASDSATTGAGVPGAWKIAISAAGAGGFTLSVTQG